ncbi:MAG: hypothetical protein ACK4GT_16785, partial [Pararhodobacter sp.]
ATALSAPGAHAFEISYSSHLPPSTTVNSEGIIPLFEAVVAESTTPVEIKYFWAGSLFNAAGNFEAARDGTVMAAFTQPQSNQAELRINSLFADMALYGGDPYATAAAYTQTILLDCPRCADEYAENGVRFMGAHAATPAAMICAIPVSSMDDLRGRRVIGPPGYARWAQELGSTQLDIPPPQRMEAMQRGQGECTVAAREWLTSFSLADVANTIVDVSTGSQFAISFLTFNAEAWEDMPQDVRDAILRNIPHAIARIITAGVERDAAAIRNAVERGVTLTDLDGAYAEAFEAFMEGQRERLFADAERRGVADPGEIIDAFAANLERWEALIAEHGTENYAQLLWDEIYSRLED